MVRHEPLLNCMNHHVHLLLGRFVSSVSSCLRLICDGLDVGLNSGVEWDMGTEAIGAQENYHTIKYPRMYAKDDVLMQLLPITRRIVTAALRTLKDSKITRDQTDSQKKKTRNQNAQA